MRRIIDEAENPVVIAGPKVRHDKALFELVEDFSKKKGLPVIATGGSIKAFADKKLKAEQMSLLHAVNLLLDGDLKIKGKKPDVAVFVGTEYAIANNVFSTLKNWGEVKTVSISQFFQPNASVSLGNLNEEVFKESIEVLKG